MIFTFAALLLSAWGCDKTANDPVTGINPGCNNAGKCVYSFYGGQCWCCDPTNRFCGDHWTCDNVNFPYGCFTFKGSACRFIDKYYGVMFGVRVENPEDEIYHSIGDEIWSSIDISAQVQHVLAEAGWPGTVISPELCFSFESGVYTCSFKVDFSEYYDLSCGTDSMYIDWDHSCEANYDYGQRAYYTWQIAMGVIGSDIGNRLVNDLNVLLQAEPDASNNFLGLGWTSTSVVDMYENVYMVPMSVTYIYTPTSYYYIVHGNSNAGCDDSEGCDTRLADETAQYAVRCCADNDPGGWNMNDQFECAVYTNSEVPDCYVTDHETAVTICSAAGGRLCTKAELEYPYLCSAGGGCGSNRVMAWSSDEGVVSIQPKYYVVKGSTSGSCLDDDCSARLESADSSFPVRCCSDYFIAGWKQNTGCSMYTQSKVPGCVSASWDSAKGLCSAAGGRLCTKDELEGNCADGGGCTLNRYVVWSSTGESE